MRDDAMRLYKIFWVEESSAATTLSFEGQFQCLFLEWMMLWSNNYEFDTLCPETAIDIHLMENPQEQ